MSRSFNFYFDPDDQVIDIVYLSLLRDVLLREGLELKGYNGPASDLTDYKKRVSAEVIYQTFTESLRDAPAGIGFRYGSALNLVAADSVGQLIMSCQDIRQALNALRQFQLLLGISSQLHVDVHQDSASIDFGSLESYALPDYFQCFVTETLYTTLQSQGRWLSGHPLTYSKLYFPYPEPAHSAVYAAVFDCELTFNADRHRAVFDAAYLDLPIITANEQIRHIKTRQCADILRRKESRLTIENRIKAILLQAYPQFPNLEEVAARLHLSRSCLYRKLRSHQTSYQNLINEFKRDQSINLLRQTSLTIPQIAEELGFSDASSFRRAFKSWTGQQPSALRV